MPTGSPVGIVAFTLGDAPRPDRGLFDRLSPRRQTIQPIRDRIGEFLGSVGDREW
jgi:hypothetical protein